MQQQTELKHQEYQNFVQTPILPRKFCLFEKVLMLNCAELLYHMLKITLVLNVQSPLVILSIHCCI